MGNPVDLILESLDVLGLLRKLVLGNEQGEEGFLVVAVEKRSQHVVDIPTEREPERVPHVKTFDRVPDIHDLRTPQEFVVPARKIPLGRQGSLIILGQNHTSNYQP
ncbi:MAG: hypothetical protein A4E39_00344 [Methanoregulaceae archaeon PtaB.Bin152]|nr:MAG: hypothetical protein A4E39_00344 [Methanoregulaceae archaeon PtaB.Bin152]